MLDEQLADFGSRVMEHRLDFISNLEKEADRYHYAISNGIEHLSIHYLSSVSFQEKDDIKPNFLKALQKNQQRDIFKKIQVLVLTAMIWNFSSMICQQILVAKVSTVA